MSLCAIMSQSLYMLLRDVFSMWRAERPPEDTRWRLSRGTATRRKTQRTGGHRGVATRKATGDPATPRRSGRPQVQEEQCVGTCDRGLKEGAAHRCCVIPPLRSKLRAVAAALGRAARPALDSGAPVTTVRGRCGGTS